MNQRPIIARLLMLALILTGCISSQNNSTLQAIEERIGTPLELKGGYVEAYIEYTGPQAKWVGPHTFVLHVKAREGTQPSVWVTPAILTPKKAPVENLTRAPASEVTPLPEGISPPQTGMPLDAARDLLNDLAQAIEKAPAAERFKGCLYPVRAWLIKSDGAILEKQGCRAQKGWVVKASALVDEFLSKAEVSEAGS